MPGATDPAACEEDADARLLTDRWRDDAPGAAVDQNSDPNVFSFYFNAAKADEDDTVKRSCERVRGL